MTCRKCFLRGLVALSLLLTMVGLIYGQTTVKCHAKDKVKHAPKYRVGWTTYTVEGPKTLAVAIGVNPRYFNREDMTAFARQLEKDFCQEQRIVAVILDDYRAAKHYAPSIEITWPKLRERGFYELDRVTGKQQISFSLVLGNPKDEVKIDLGLGSAP